MKLPFSCILCVLSSVTAFTCLPVSQRVLLVSTHQPSTLLFTSVEEEDHPKLVLSNDEMQQQMASLKSKYPTSEADFLAAAKARSAARTASKETAATDNDWKSISDEKKQKF